MTYGYKSLASNSFARIVTGCFMLMVMTFANTFNVQAQTILSEELRDGTAPTGWTSTDVEFTTSASGYAKFTSVTGVLASPSFDLSGVTGATLNYSVAKFGSGADGPLTVEFSIDGGTNWDAFVADSDTATSSTYLNEELVLPANLIGEASVMVRLTTEKSPSFKRVRDVLLVGPDGITLAPATDVATIAELRAGTADGATRYRITGEALIAFYDSFNDRRYLVDATAGIFSEDPGNLPDSLTNIGDGITGLEGTISLENNGAVLRFSPDAGSANISVTTGNTVSPETIALAELSLDDTGKLVTIPGVTFQETGTFSTGANYTIEDGSGNTLTFRTDYYSADYIGEAIPAGKLNITGLVGGYGTDPQIFARSSAGFEIIVEPVTVTFRVNTSTISDTLSANSFVQVRGELRKTLADEAYGSQNVTWDAASTPVATNIGGDYWSVDVLMAPGDSLVYKYYVGLDSSTDAADGGWEPNGPFNGNYLYTLPDTTEDVNTDLVYYNNGNGRISPFVDKADSIGVLFRVNVGAQVQDGSFDPENHSVSVRGTPSPLDWGANTVDLTAETPTGDNYFYSAVAYFDSTELASVTTSYTIRHKFFLNNGTGDGGYESSSDRDVTLGALKDTTLYYKFFSNTPPTDGVIVETTLSFEVNVGILSGLGLFNTTIDTISVRGTFNGWGEDRMTFDSRNGVYEVDNLPYTKAVDAVEKYKYYIKWDSRRDSVSSDFYLDGIQAANSGWEEPGITGGTDRTFTIQNQANQDKISEFYNGVEPEALLTSNNVDGGATTVTFSIDMTPATSSNTNEAGTLFNPASDSVFLFVDTPFFALTNGITVPGDGGENFITESQAEIDRLMFTDGDGDMIYELELALTLPTLNHIGFRIAYGEPTSADGQLVPNGGGFDAGRRHYQYIQPQVDAEGNVTWPSTFAFSQLTWKFDDLPFEQPPSYTTVGIEDELGNVESFRLNQNYPNPFNPSTTISFNLPNAADVSLAVYNVLGQRVATLLNNKKYTSGSHTLSFDASNLASGIYIYRLEAGSFTSLKRMTLIK